MMGSLICISASVSYSGRCRSFSSTAVPTASITQLKRVKSFPAVRCLQGPSQKTKEEQEEEAESVSPAVVVAESSISSYKLCAGLGAVGFLETGYLTFLKFTGTDALCPIGGGNCTDILNSDYAMVYGIPLPLIGMACYGLVGSLGLLLARKDFLSGHGEINAQLTLLATTTSMATASAYFLYLLSTKFTGVTCSYCILSAALSFTAFFTILKDLGWKEIRNVVGFQLLLAGLIVAALNSSYSTFEPPVTSFVDTYLPYYETTVVKESSPFALSLAKHLRSIGAKMYGAFWCTHCLEQKQMFGYEAVKILDYIECFPEGVKKGVKIAKACSDVGIEGFPTWVINGQVLSGEKDLIELARESGFALEPS